MKQSGEDIRISFGSESGRMKNGSHTDASVELRYYATDVQSDPELIEIPVAYTVTEGGDEWTDE